MCGITGLVTSDGRTADGALLARMNDSHAHRGPDAKACVALAGAGLAHRRLTILDPSSGAQPMTTADGRYTLVYNGEIYNYRSLNRTLEAAGYTFPGHCDTDTLLAAWQHWGRDCVAHLRGMFAFAIWDAETGRLFAARDRLGIKPLYYAITAAGDFLFGSELKSLRAHPDLDRRLDPRAIESYLALGYIAEPYAIYQGARKLSAGCTLTWQAGMTEPRVARYWDVDFSQADPRSVDVADTASELRALLDEAVRMRLVADVPLGAFLSGGLDSSAIVALMAGATSEPVNTCAIGFAEASFDESAYARQVAETFGTAHREHRISANDFALVDRLVDVYDEPFADASALPTYRVCELARQQVTVALSGDGGDENFAGYRRYRLHANESRVRARLPQALRRPVFGALGALYPKLDRAPQFLRARTTFQALARDTAGAYCHSVSIMPSDMRRQLYSDAFTRQLAGFRIESLFADTAADANTDDPLSMAQYLDYKTWLPGDILTKVDRASMAHSLEVRVPLLDHEFVNWSARLPSDVKLRRGQGKYVFKKAFEDTLDTDIRDRRKQGFSVPLSDWFRGPLRQAGEHALTQGPLVASGLFDAKALSQHWQRHVDGVADHGASLWSLLMLSNFLARESGEVAWGSPAAIAT